MVKLRLQRYGTKKRPFYRIVAANTTNRRDGRFLEQVGYFNPLQTQNAVTWKEERVKYWLEKGAIATDTVRGLLKKIGIEAKTA